MFGYMTTDFSTVEMLDEQEIEAEGTSKKIQTLSSEKELWLS